MIQPKILKRCKTCNKVLCRSAQRAQTYPNNTIKYCRLCFRRDKDYLAKAEKNLKFGRGLFKGKRLPYEVWNKGMAKVPRKRDTESFEYRSWRKSVFERDNYTCQICYKTGGLYLQADHIKMWLLFPKLRYDINNGQTLCRKCHAKKTSQELRKYWKNQYTQSLALHTAASAIGRSQGGVPTVPPQPVVPVAN